MNRIQRQYERNVLITDVIGMVIVAMLALAAVTFGKGWIPPKPEPQPPAVTNAPPPSTQILHTTAFLREGAKWTTHTYFSPKLSDAQRLDRIQRTKADGYSVIYLYAANEGDYGKQSLLYTHDQQALWRKHLQAMWSAGLAPILWIRADDSSGLNKWTSAQWTTFFKLITADLDDLIHEYVIGLEVNEYWTISISQTQAYIGELRKFTRKKIGVHTGSIQSIGYAATADRYYLQFGFSADAASVAAQVRQAKAKLPGVSIIAAEYDKDGQARGRSLGEAAVAAGADGFGNGGTSRAIELLKQRTGGTPNGPPDSPQPPPTGALLSSVTAAQEFYIRWQATGTDTWPTDDDKGKTLQGRIIVNGVFVESFKKGQTTQHLKNAYGSDGHAVRGIKKGATVRIKLRSLDGKKETNELPFIWPWKDTAP